jgi:nucleotide-binding universal stress UspA family protein
MVAWVSLAFSRGPALADQRCTGKALHCSEFDRIPCRWSGPKSMRTFLVVTDESEESRAALRFAARRAVAVGGAVHILAIVRQPNFSAFGAVQATIEQEARDRAEMLAHGVAGNLLAESGIMPTISVKIGNGQKIVREFLDSQKDIAALILGAAAGNTPGPLVMHFSAHAGSLPCPLYVIPENYDEAEADHG